MKSININNLQKLGLSSAEANVYLSLLKKKNFTATEISKISEISRSKIYEILNKLIGKGLCIEILGSIKKYSPVNPKTAFNSLLQNYKQQYEQEIEAKKILVSEISDNLFPLYLTEKDQSDPLDYIEVIRDKKRIADKIHMLERKAQLEVVSFSKAPYAMNFNNLAQTKNRIIFKKNIVYKGIYEIIDAQSLEFMHIIQIYQAEGEEIRIAEKLPMKMHIFDERIVFFTLENRLTPKSNLTAMVIEHADLAATLKIIFDVLWKKSITVEEFLKKRNKK